MRGVFLGELDEALLGWSVDYLDEVFYSSLSVTASSLVAIGDDE
jgi:hypothetical protein